MDRRELDAIVSETSWTSEARAAIVPLIRLQARVACGELPSEVEPFLETASTADLLRCALRIAVPWCSTPREIFVELYVAMDRAELRTQLAARFGPLSDYVSTSIGLLRDFEIDEALRRLPESACPEDVVIRTGAQKLRLKGYREGERKSLKLS